MDNGDAVFSITGTRAVGQTLTAAIATADPDGNGSGGFSYTWQSSTNGTTWANVGTNSASYTIAAADEGKQLRLIAFYTDAQNFSETVTTSVGTIPFVDNGDAVFSISGTRAVGQILTAAIATADPDGNGSAAITYTWQSSSDGTTWANVGTNSASYTIAAADEGKQLRLIAAYTDAQNFSESVTTAAGSIPFVDNGDAVFSITGTRAVGQTLTAAIATADPDGNGSGGFSYTWQSSTNGTTWANVGTNSASYTIAAADEGKQLRLIAAYTDAQNFSETVTTSVGTIPFVDNGDAVFSISGTRAVGQILTAAIATADPDGNGSAAITYTWQSSSDGTTWANVGTNSASYTIAAADEGKQLRLIAAYTDAQNFSESVTTAAGSIPFVDNGDAVFSITGTRAVGQTLTAAIATADPDGNGSGGFSYTWQSSTNGTTWANVGTNSASYTIAAADEGKQLRLLTAYTDAQNFSETVTTSVGTIPFVDNGDAVFSITGTRAVGQTLTAAIATADPDGNGSGGFSYTWQSSTNGTTWANVGTNSASYTIAAADEGKQLRLIAFYTDAQNFSETVTTSVGTIPFVDNGDAVFSISGTRAVGQILTAAIATADPDGNGSAAITYTWQSSSDGTTWANVGTNSASYTIAAADEGKQLRLIAAYTDAQNFSESVTTAAGSIPFVDNGDAVFSITGTRAVGQTLTAAIATADPDGNGSGGFSYTWQSSTNGTTWANVGTNSASYTIAAADEGKQLRLIAAYTDAQNFSETVTTSVGTIPFVDNGDAVFSISGTRAVGQILTAAIATADPDGNGSAAITYTWQSSSDGTTWANVGTNSASYTIAAADEGKQLRLIAAYTDAQNFSESVTTAAGSIPFVDNGDAVFSITGTRAVGQTLTAAIATADPDGNGSAAITYTWQSSTNGTTWANVGTNSASYTIAAADEGKQLRLIAAYTDAQNFSETVTTSVGTIPFVDNGDAVFSISGTRAVGQILTAAIATADPDGNGSAAITYTWQSSSDGTTWANVGTNSASYTIAAADEGKQLRLIAAYTDAQNFSESVTTAAGSIPFVDNGDAVFSITGTRAVGQTLTAAIATADPDGNGSAAITYTWQSSTNGTTWANVGTNSASYTIAAADEGKQLRLIAFYTDAQNFSETVTTSVGTIPFVDNGDAVFSITGTRAVGQTLTAAIATADPDGNGSAAITYTWQSSTNGTTWANVGTNSASYTIAAADEGKQLRLIAFYTDAQNFSETVTTSVGTIPFVDNGDAVFSITGTRAVGQILTAAIATADPDGNGSGGFSYTWQSSTNGTTWANVGTNSATYTIAAADEGKQLRLIAAYTDAQNFSESVTTAAGSISFVDNGDAVFSISGTRAVGQILTAAIATADPDGNGSAAITYTWQSSSDGTTWANVGTNSASYTIAAADEGKQLRLIAAYTDAQNFSESVTTAAGSIPFVDNGDAVFSISGTRAVGQTLTAAIATADPDGNGSAAITYTWQSSSDGTTWANVGTNSASYTIAAADEGKQLRLIAAYTDAQNFSESVTTAAGSIPFVDNGDAVFSISGTRAVGQILTAAIATADPDGNGSAAITYTWQSSTNGTTWANVGTNSASYTIAAADEGKQLRLIAAYTDAQNFSESVTTAAGSIPFVDNGDAVFSISGTRAVGQILTAAIATADPDGNGSAAITYTWQSSSDGTTWANVGTNSASYTIAAADEGKQLRLIAAYTDAQNFSESVTTAAGSIPFVDNGDAVFSISGTRAVGQILTAAIATADPDGNGSAAITYTWQSSSDGTTWANVGTNSASYTIAAADEGKQLRLIAAYTDAQNFSESVTTAAGSIPFVDNGDAVFSISGTRAVGQILTAAIATADPDGNGSAAITYTWQSSSNGTTWANVGTNSASYTIAAADEGKQLRLIAAYTDAQNFSESVTTAAGSVADTTPPTVTALSVNGSTLTLTLSEALSSVVPATNRFSVLVGGVARTVSSAAVNTTNNTVNLTLASAVTAGQAVTLAYTDATAANDTTGIIQDVPGNDLATFTARSVTNSTVASDTTPPTVTALSVNGSTLTLTLSEALSSVVPATNRFSVLVGGVARTVSSAAVNTTNNTVNLTLASAVTAGQAVTLAYTDATAANDTTGIIQDVPGNDLATFTARSVTNSTVASDTTPPTVTALSVNGSTLTLTLSEALSSVVPATNRFSVLVGGVARTVSSAAVNTTNNTVNLTLASAVTAGQAVTLAYTDATAANDTTGIIQDVPGNDLATFTARSVTNSTVASDTTPPTVTALSVNGSTLTLTLSEALSSVVPATNRFSVLVGGVARTVSSAAVNTTNNTVNLTLASAVTAGQAVTLAYTDATAANDTTGIIQDVPGNDLATFTARSVTNSTVASDTTPPTVTALSVNGSTLTLTLSEALSSVVPATNRFSVLVGGVARTVSSAAVNTTNNTVNLTLASAVTAGQAVTLAYTDATAANDTTGIIQDVPGNDLATFTARSVTNSTVASDTTPPTVTALSVNGSTLTLTLSEALSSVVPATNRFSVLVGGVARTVSSAAVNTTNNTVNLTLASAVTAGQAVTLAYTDATAANDTTGIIQDVPGNDLATFTARSVTNSTVASDTTPPTVTALSVNGSTLTLTLSEALSSVVPATNRFSVLVGGVARTVSSAAVNTTNNTVNLTLASAVTAGQAVTLAYTDATAANDTTGIIQDVPGNDLATFTARSVTNTLGTSNPDSITGTSGIDLINGGLGNDTLTGGLGADVFRFDSVLNASTNVDRITDFTIAQSDRIQLENTGTGLFTGIPTAGTLASTAFRVGTSFTTTSQRIRYDAGTGNLSYDPDGSGAAASILFATLSPGLALTNSQFLVT